MGWSTLPRAPVSFTLGEKCSLARRRVDLGDSREIQSRYSSGRTRLYGVLTRSTILKHKGNGKSTKNSSQKSSARYKNRTTNGKMTRLNDGQNSITRTFLMDAIEEAIYRQKTAIDCIELERSKLLDILRSSRSNQDCDTKLEQNNLEGNSNLGKNEREPKVALNRVDKRSRELSERITKLEELRHDMLEGGGRNKRDISNGSLSVADAESGFRKILGSKGKACSILDRPKESWKIVAERSKGEFGRPKGFTGLVFYSPLGVPILVGKLKADSDGILRRASQGSDLWFQVEDYEGSRVLLRSSLIRGTKDSKRCLQMAADLAAFYSVWGGGHCSDKSNLFDKVPVMYTDSKHVAKRGTKVGRMRKGKSLGRIMGQPSSVEEIARGRKPS